MKNKLYQNLETIAIISWLLMDFCWMSKYINMAYIFVAISASFSFCALVFYDNNKKSEAFILGASWFWIIMNSSWMCGDEMSLPWLIFVAKIYFVISLLMVIIALIIAKIENEKLNFKRLKIK